MGWDPSLGFLPPKCGVSVLQDVKIGQIIKENEQRAEDALSTGDGRSFGTMGLCFEDWKRLDR